MRFLVDAQLPPLLAVRLNAWGHDATHASDLPAGSDTADADLATAADLAGRVVVSKDADFLEMRRDRGTPRRLLRVAVGNAGNFVLLKAFEDHLAAAVDLLATADMIELNADAAIVVG